MKNLKINQAIKPPAKAVISCDQPNILTTIFSTGALIKKVANILTLKDKKTNFKKEPAITPDQ